MSTFIEAVAPHMNANEAKRVTVHDSDSVVTEIFIAAPAKRIFRALTDQTDLIRWFTDPKCPIHQWEIDPRPGGRYRYFLEPDAAAVSKISVFECHGQILEFDPPRLLAYTWVASWHEDKSHPTIVRWELSERPNGTHVRVTHTGLAQEPIARKDYSGGWLEAITLLKQFAESNQER